MNDNWRDYLDPENHSTDESFELMVDFPAEAVSEAAAHYAANPSDRALITLLQFVEGHIDVRLSNDGCDAPARHEVTGHVRDAWEAVLHRSKS